MLQIHVQVYISTSTYKIYDLKYCNTSTSRVLTVFTYKCTCIIKINQIREEQILGKLIFNQTSNINDCNDSAPYSVHQSFNE